jgi:hypothetical protein
MRTSFFGLERLIFAIALVYPLIVEFPVVERSIHYHPGAAGRDGRHCLMLFQPTTLSVPALRCNHVHRCRGQTPSWS